MADPKLSIALSHYDRHVPLFDGSVTAEGLDLEVLEVGQSHPLRHGDRRHERMLRDGEFDIAELSLSSYLISQSRGMPIKAIPVFPRRLFSLSQMWVNVDAGIESPRDLIGRNVGLSTFQTTLSVLAKGDLQSEYDVPWREINWVIDRPEALPIKAEGVSIRYLEKGESIGAMLERGEIDALMMPHPPDEVVNGSDKIRRLFRDARGEELKYFRKNGFYPIMHVVAFKNEVLEQYPFAVQSVMDAFEKAKVACREYYADPNWSSLAWTRHLYEEERETLGEDYWPYGLKRNRANLERFMGYSQDQALMDKAVTVEELFVESTLDS